MFTGKTLLITGGTGSFGNAVLNRFLATDIGEIRIFSRDELKQDDMRHYYQREYPEYSNKLKFYILSKENSLSLKLAITPAAAIIIFHIEYIRNLSEYTLLFH